MATNTTVRNTSSRAQNGQGIDPKVTLRVLTSVRRGDFSVRMPQDWKGSCLLYTSEAADDMQCVDLGGRRIIK